MSAHRTPPNRRPLYVSLGAVVCSSCVVLAFGTTAQNAAPIFNTGNERATDAAAAPSVSPPPSALIPLPAPVPAPVRTGGPATAVAATVHAAPKPAPPTPYSPGHTLSLATEAAIGLAATEPSGTTGSTAARQHAPGGKPASHVTKPPAKTPDRGPRPEHDPKPHPTPPPTGSGGSEGSTGDGGSQLPWWWWFAPHGPGSSSVPTIPTGPTGPSMPSFPHYPSATHTTISIPTDHGGMNGGDSGYRHSRRH